MTEHVNHPAHYNRHPSGVECIDIIRHYTCDIANALKYLWRAGLKGEQGMTPVAKEVEDLRKAAWYIADFIDNCDPRGCRFREANDPHVVRLADGRTIHCEDITRHYTADIAHAVTVLWSNGAIADGRVLLTPQWHTSLFAAIQHINHRIETLKQQSS